MLVADSGGLEATRCEKRPREEDGDIMSDVCDDSPPQHQHKRPRMALDYTSMLFLVYINNCRAQLAMSSFALCMCHTYTYQLARAGYFSHKIKVIGRIIRPRRDPPDCMLCFG